MFSSLLSRAARTQKQLFVITRPFFTCDLGFIQIFGTPNLKVTSPSSLLEKFTNQLRGEFRSKGLSLAKVRVFHRFFIKLRF